jgi:hypothetical protein
LEKSEFETFVNNIGAGDKFTSEDYDEILADVLEEAGENPEDQKISIEKLKDIMLEIMTKK